MRFPIVLVFAGALAAQAPADLARQAQQRLRDGKPDEALALYKQALEASPDSPQANTGAGIVLDLMGNYAEARKHFSKAIEVAATPQAKAQALRSMAMSYAFEHNCKGAAKYEAPLYQQYLDARDFYNAGEIADELARVCIESGSLDDAAEWYRRGHEAGLREPNITPERKDLWDFRWEHAQARIAARRGNTAEARKHMAAAKAILDKGTNPAQAVFFPYLAGYVAFYDGDYKGAIAELEKANQNDPFIASLIAQAHEKSGDSARAREYYQRVLKTNAHNPAAALSRELARKKL